MKTFIVKISKGLNAENKETFFLEQVQESTPRDAQYKMQQKYNKHHSEVSVLSKKMSKENTFEELKAIFEK
ncbi:hypothetical protein [Chryseobacterium terrae]|uniref:Uncharacterized protein n=1 Tax=Chryseobacterium terrae TaxID=3163299 RepID=A0ABW8Y492_9FLAO